MAEPAFKNVVMTVLHQHEWPLDVDQQHALLCFVQDCAWRHYCDDQLAITPTNHEGIWKTAAAAMRAAVHRDHRAYRRHVHQLAAVAPSLDSPTVSSSLALEMLSKLVETHFALALDCKIKDGDDMMSDLGQQTTKQHQLAEVLASWKHACPRMHLVHLYVNDDEEHCEPLVSPHSIVDHMAGVWKDKFHNVADYDEHLAATVAAYSSEMVWPPPPAPSKDDFVKILQCQRWSAPGPDLLSYGFLKLVPQHAAEICLQLWHQLSCSSPSLPHWFGDTWLAIVPKDQSLTPGRMRPSALKNTLAKLTLLPLSHCLTNSLISWLPAMQQGACPTRSTAANLIAIENGAHQVSKQEQQGALILCDIADAFPSISHKWLQLCFTTTGMPGWLRAIMGHYLSCHSAAVRHGASESMIII